MQPRKKRRIIVLLLSAVAALLLYGVYTFGGVPCPTKMITGIPCPSCGISRALGSLARGKIAESFQWHPLWPLALAWPVLYFLQQSERFPQLSRLWRRRSLWIAALALLLAVYLLRMGLLFPHKPPLDFQKDALLPSIWTGLHS